MVMFSFLASTPAQQPDTCSQCFFSRIRGWRASATSCKAAESTCRCRFESKCECFLVANILSLKTCNSNSSLCCPEFCALPLSLLLFIFIHVTSFVSGPMLPALCLKRRPFHTPVDPVQLSLNASSQALTLKHRIPIHKIIVTMMLLR